MQKIGTYSGQALTIADAKISGSTLWVLDEVFGVYKFWSFMKSKYVEKASYKIPYGNKQMLTVMNDCIQVVFEFLKDTYIAELFFNKDNLYLNRFYDQVTGIRKVLIVD